MGVVSGRRTTSRLQRSDESVPECRSRTLSLRLNQFRASAAELPRRLADRA